ncbi:hypothetical protein CHGG_02515 [Chaetomium globosum CBS 148.51]|uniref:GAR domain-containing protein n=1 Tax=Chaetomium globosum (strain ATCC 6205 / CBS 148.51 / DSM 1962 / NBRC 6347 / NRRL 1970) TaxID=306901 RepID=Q2HB89_CHAGB|nr:uncharacterized protein CHGG_02515 [Chaetomium globosum CBS 148.51]EAQ90580.1 hypothetical protein CHGG_02515 [Chaetomium globosum CBS 148.51]
MNESPPPRTPAHLAPARGRQLHSAMSDSSPARQRSTDDLLANLNPRTVVNAFRNPSGGLKACLAAATPAEQAFALRVAIASDNIYAWLGELSAWPWPAGGGSAGFEMPRSRRSKLWDTLLPTQHESLGTPDQGYNGSIPTADVARYERRIDEIAQGLEELEIEEIKSQVLNNHIMPLSRPGTPVMGSGRSTMSLSSFAMLDDLTAIVTATTVQALPNLSKLTRLMSAWNFRLLVLRKIPVFLTSIADAEAALQSGWNAINTANRQNGATSAALSREAFDVMKSVLGRKVAKAGRDLDAMLDILEGQPDTLPEDWIDRMDTLEHAYGEWTVACDRKVQENDLAGMVQQVVPPRAAPEQPLREGTDGSAPSVSPVSNGSPALAPSGEAQPLANASSPDSDSARDLSPPPEVRPPVIKIYPTIEEEETPATEGVYPDTDNDFDQSASDGSASAEPFVRAISEPLSTGPSNRRILGDAVGFSSTSDSELSDISENEVFQAEDHDRRASTASESSTVLHEAPSTFVDSFSSDLVDQGTPERPRLRHMDSTDLSGLESFRSSTRSMSVTFNDKPTITELPSFVSPPGTPTRSMLEDEDDVTQPNTPAEKVIPGMDDQLQRQIGQILESVPAKIRLTAEPPAVNLNPPDFKMPIPRKSSRGDAIPRTQSNMSMRSAYSRSATPSFTLAPARSSRPRHRGNQEIKLYHLSRSNGEAPIKLFIRCVGEHGERVMVRVGGGWADLGEYLKEYATHHSLALRRRRRRRQDRGQGHPADWVRASPSNNNEPHHHSPASRPKTPLASVSRLEATPPSGGSSLRSRSSSRVSWDEDEGAVALGMAGPRAKQIEMSEESKAWVESIKEKVRIASGERKPSGSAALPSIAGTVAGGRESVGGRRGSVGVGMGVVGSGGGGGGGDEGGLEASLMDRGGEARRGMFGEIGKVGSTKRLFRRG